MHPAISEAAIFKVVFISIFENDCFRCRRGCKLRVEFVGTGALVLALQAASFSFNSFALAGFFLERSVVSPMSSLML
jgi:hypothetical protein